MNQINHLRNKLATAKNKHAADTYGLSLSPIKLLINPELTYYSWASNDTFKAFFIPLIYVEGKLMSQVCAGTNEQKDHR